MKRFVLVLLAFCLAGSTLFVSSLEAKKKKSKKGFERINLNTVTAKELKKIPGISSTKAKRIIEYREEKDGFESIDDLKEISHETKKGNTVYDFATKKGKWKKAMKPLIEAEIFTLKGGSAVVDQKALYKKLYPETVNINKASLSELKVLPGISKTKAQRIIDNRPYSSVEDLKNITHETKSGNTVYDFATKKGKWKKSIRPLIESGRIICSGGKSKKRSEIKKKAKKKVKKKVKKLIPVVVDDDDDEWGD